MIASKKVSTFSAKTQVDVMQFDKLIVRCGYLEKLIRSTAYVLRLMGRTPPPVHGVNLTNGMLSNFLKSGERISICDVRLLVLQNMMMLGCS